MYSKANKTLRDILSRCNVTAQQFKEAQESLDFHYLHDDVRNTAVFRIDKQDESSQDVCVERYGVRQDTNDWDYENPSELRALSNTETAFLEYRINEWFYDVEPHLSWKFWQDQDFYNAV